MGKKENVLSSSSNANRSSAHSKSVIVCKRATPITPTNEIRRPHGKRRQSMAKRQKEQSKENCNDLNTRPNKKYEYGNASVLAWMQKQKRKRLEQQKCIQQEKKLKIQKRKAYISNLNNKQKQRAQKVINKKKLCKVPIVKRREMIFDDDNAIVDDQEDEQNENDIVHPANITLDKLQKDLSESPEQKKIKSIPVPIAHVPDDDDSHSDNGNVDPKASLLLDQTGNVDPMLLRQIYDCLQQNKSMNVQKPNKSLKTCSSLSRKVKISKKRPFKRIKSQIMVSKKRKLNTSRAKNKKIIKPQKRLKVSASHKNIKKKKKVKRIKRKIV